MIEILEECIRFKTTSQRLADKTRVITKKVWFSDFRILEIDEEINRKTCQQPPNTVTETINTEKARMS